MGLTHERGINPRGTTCETLVRHQTLSEPDGCRNADRSFDQTYPSDRKSNGLTEGVFRTISISFRFL